VHRRFSAAGVCEGTRSLQVFQLRCQSLLPVLLLISESQAGKGSVLGEVALSQGGVLRGFQLRLVLVNGNTGGPHSEGAFRQRDSLLLARAKVCHCRGCHLPFLACPVDYRRKACLVFTGRHPRPLQPLAKSRLVCSAVLVQGRQRESLVRGCISALSSFGRLWG